MDDSAMPTLFINQSRYLRQKIASVDEDLKERGPLYTSVGIRKNKWYKSISIFFYIHKQNLKLISWKMKVEWWGPEAEDNEEWEKV